MTSNYDIFISYRRKDTADKAEHLFSLLEMAGYKGQVSFDRENFDGRFDLEILQRLDDCKDFIVGEDGNLQYVLPTEGLMDYEYSV